VVGNTPGVLTETTADLAFALLMAAARRIVESDNYTSEVSGGPGGLRPCSGRIFMGPLWVSSGWGVSD